jgi:hypothetical protein
MSRVILSLNDDQHKTHRVVVGWDRPLQTYFWQIFSPEPDDDPDTGFPKYIEGWEEMENYGGYTPREIQRAEYLATWPYIPAEVKDLVTDEVLAVLRELRTTQDRSYNDNIMMLGGTQED